MTNPVTCAKCGERWDPTQWGHTAEDCVVRQLSAENELCSEALARESRERKTLRDLLDGQNQRLFVAARERDRLLAENARLRSLVDELAADWDEQASADENGWSYRRGNNDFNEGAAFVLRRGAAELRAMLSSCALPEPK